MKPILLFVVTFLVTYAQFCGSAQASDATDAKSRDLKRITDVNSTYTALEMYYLDNVRYPSTLKDIEQVGYYFRVTPNDPTAWKKKVPALCRRGYIYEVYSSNDGIKSQFFRISSCVETEFEKAKSDNGKSPKLFEMQSPDFGRGAGKLEKRIYFHRILQK